jgi:hydroxymethylglutaryl-CoA reductase (NADPH)
LKAEAESTTHHGRLLRIEPRPAGRRVILSFFYSTGDAQGMNMAVKATDRACRWLMAHSTAIRYFVFSGMCSEKRPSGFLLSGGKGKRVSAGASLPADIVRAYLHLTPADMVEVWRDTLMGHVHAHATGFNAQYANGLTAVFIACGQDVANVANSAVGVTEFEVTPDGDLYASVTLPSPHRRHGRRRDGARDEPGVPAAARLRRHRRRAEVRRDRGGDAPRRRVVHGGGDRERRVRGRP